MKHKSLKFFKKVNMKHKSLKFFKKSFKEKSRYETQIFNYDLSNGAFGYLRVILTLS